MKDITIVPRETYINRFLIPKLEQIIKNDQYKLQMVSNDLAVFDDLSQYSQSILLNHHKYLINQISYYELKIQQLKGLKDEKERIKFI